MKPYRQTQFNIDDNSFYRIFDMDIEDPELVWHRDKSDRECYVVEGEGWMFQFEDELPFTIREGDTIHISRMDYHRLIAGQSRLVLKIYEN